MILQALPWSVGLLTVATLIAFAVGSVLGARLAWPRSGRLIRTLVPVLMVLTSIPFYLLAIILIYLFAVALAAVPAGGRGRARRSSCASTCASALDIVHHAILPGLAIVLGSVGFWALGMRSQMVSVLGEDYITFAEAKGLSPRRIFCRYGMRNALLPQVTALALSLGHVVSGAVLVEVIFNYPGLGALLYDAVRGQDYFVIQGVVLMLIADARGAPLHHRPHLSAPRPEDPPMNRALRVDRPQLRARGGSATSLLWGLAILTLIALFSLIGPLFVDAARTRRSARCCRASRPRPSSCSGPTRRAATCWTLLVFATPNTLKMGLIAGFIGVGVGTVLGLDRRLLRRARSTRIIRVVADALLTVPAIAILVIIAGNVAGDDDRGDGARRRLARLDVHHPHHPLAGADHPRALLHRGRAGERRGPVRDPVPRDHAQPHALHRRELRRRR